MPPIYDAAEESAQSKQSTCSLRQNLNAAIGPLIFGA